MKYLITILFIFNISTALSFDIINCCSDNEKPRIVKVDLAPMRGPYIKVEPYHVTAGANDPYSEEVLFFMIAKDMQKEMDYLKFHHYFKTEMDKLQKAIANKPGSFLSEKELYPIIYNYLEKTGNEVPRDIFNDYIIQQRDRIESLLKVFAFKSVTTYYQVLPDYTQIDLEKKGTLPVVTLKNDYGVLKTTIAANKISVYDSKKMEDKEKKALLETYKDDLNFIIKCLPDEGAPLKKHLQKVY